MPERQTIHCLAEPTVIRPELLPVHCDASRPAKGGMLIVMSQSGKRSLPIASRTIPRCAMASQLLGLSETR